MKSISGWGGRVRGLFADTKGPWGPSGGDAGGDPPSGDGGGNGPWGEPTKRGRRPGLGSPNVSALDELLR
ncbi:MAG: protease modulator HflK, partial [Sphingomicrobium sp.]